MFSTRLFCRPSLKTSFQWFIRFNTTRSSSLQHDFSPNASFQINDKNFVTDSWTNITPLVLSLVKRNLYLTPGNPLYLLSEQIKQFFRDYPSFCYPSPAVDLFTNFDTLLISKDHVSRSRSDTYYVNKDYVLRSHTSAHQYDCFKKSDFFICIADVYRRDEIDCKHFPAFHQCEVAHVYGTDHQLINSHGLKEVFEKEPAQRTKEKQEWHTQEAARLMEVTMKLKVEELVKNLLQTDVPMRWVDAYFPFTHPSWELEVFYNNDWYEVLGSGIVEHRLLLNAGIENKVGWALGLGLERLAMLKYQIPDIRLFWSKDTGFLSQFENAKPQDKIVYKPISTHPQCINDMSFWLPSGKAWSPNDFYDLVRSVGGDLIEQVKLIDEWTNKNGRVSNCFRIVYRSHNKVLEQSEVNKTHNQIKEAAAKMFGVELR